MADTFIELHDSKWHEGVKLDEYQGEISLVTARQDAEGKVYLKWGFPQNKDREPIDKSIPWKVKIGDSKAEAVTMLREFIDALVGKTPPDDDPPF